MLEDLKIETDRLRDLIEENRNLLKKAFALVRAFDLGAHALEKPKPSMARLSFHPWVAYQGVSRVWF